MTMPGGFEIAEGYVTVRAKIDRDQINRAANEAGSSAGDNMGAATTKKFTERTRNDKGQFVTAGDAAGMAMGNAGGESFTKTFTSKLRDSRGRFISAGSESAKGFGLGFKGSTEKESSSWFSGFISKLRKSGEDSGASFFSRFNSKANAGLAVAGDKIAAVLVPAAVAAGPLIGATLGAGIITGIGAAGIGIAIMQQFKNDDVEKAGKDFKTKLFGLSKEEENEYKKKAEGIAKDMAKLTSKGSLTSAEQDELGVLKMRAKEVEEILDRTDNNILSRATKSFEQPLIKGFDAATKFAEKLEPTLTKIFDNLLPGLESLGSGFGGMIKGILPGFESLSKVMQPFMDILGKGLERIGKAFGDIFTKWANDPEALEGMQKALGDIIGLVTTLIYWLGDFVLSTSKAYAQFKNTWGAIANWFTGTIGPSLIRAWNQLKGAFWAVINWFGGPFKNFFVKTWNGIASWFAGIPKWFTDRWNSVKSIWSGFTNWVSVSFKGYFTKAWSNISGWFAGVPKWFSDKWTAIKNTFSNTLSAIGTNISSKVASFKGYFSGLRDSIGSIFKSAGQKITDFKNGAIKAFQLARDGIGTAWNGIKDKAKGPVNFVIDPVYKNLANLWNRVAGAVGIKTKLDPIKKFAKGGLVPGAGNRDTVPAMLTPGEGILTKKEMAKIGGAKGFANLRKEIQYFNDGGIVGGIKDWVGGKLKAGKEKLSGLFRGAIYPGAKALSDQFVYPLINGMDNTGFSRLPRAGATKLVDSVLGWFKKDDSANSGAIGGGGGSAMGWKRQIAVLRQAFPGLALLSGFRPGSRTLSGNRSYHSLGRAVDVPARKDVAQWINSKYGNSTKELITPWNSLNIHNGRRHTYTGDIYAQHAGTGRFKGNEHDHWAMDDISQRPPGWFMGYNGTGKTETLVNADKIPDVLKPVVNNNVIYVTIPADTVDDFNRVIESVTTYVQSVNSGTVGY